MKKLFTSIFILLLSTQISWSQSFVSINPNSGLRGQTLNTIVTGSNFFFTWGSAPGTWDFYMNMNSNYIYPNSVIILDDDNLDVEWTIPSNVPVGQYTVEWDDLITWPPHFVPGGFLIGDGGISGTVYRDADSSLTQNANENGMFNRKLMLFPDSVITYSKNDGSYLFVTTAGNKSVEVVPGPNWLVTSDTTQNATVTNSVITGVDFGLKSTTNVFGIQAIITPTSVPRCNWDRRYLLTYSNSGTVMCNGTVEYVRHSSVSFNSANPPPDNVSGNIYSWDYDSLYPGEARNIEVFVNLPGANATFTSGVSATALDDLGVLQDSDGEEIVQTTICAFDPNDKSVIPPGIQAANYTLMSDTLDFLIRFQNTGNDTAFKVVLLDTLDKDILDINSFSLINYSHPVVVELTTNGLLSFTFDNILLPDSNVNEPASNGFVRFRCMINQGLPNNTILNNTAYIYFDFNAPVITNTTLNTLVFQIPVGIDEQPDEHEVTILPNPVTNDATIVLPKSGGEYYLKIIDLTGKLVYEKLVLGDRHVIPSNELDSGVMLYQLRSKNGSKEFHGKFVVL